MEKIKVSVVVLCYNKEKYVSECLESILLQTHRNLQVVIVDDGSTDNSWKIIIKYKKRFEKVGMDCVAVRQLNSGVSAAMNAALKQVDGQYMVWCDADDWYEVNAIATLLQCMLKNKSSFARGEVAFRRETDKKIISYGKQKTVGARYIFDDYVFEKNAYCFAGIFMVEMNEFDKSVPDRTIYESRAGQNWQVILPIAYRHACLYVEKVVYNCRLVVDSHSRSAKTLKEIFYKYNEHKNILHHVIGMINEMSGTKKQQYTLLIWFKYFKKKVKACIKLALII